MGVSLAVFIIALLIYLPLNAYIPITDPVEANYALTAKEMLLSGDWLSPQIYGRYWYDKPAMIYWLIAAGYKIFGVGEFAARFPAALFSAGSVSFAYWYGTRLLASRRAGLLTALVLATSLEYWVLARMVITDAVLFFFSSVALGSLYWGIRARSGAWRAAAYFFAALAVLTKGPVGLLLPALIIFVYILVTRRLELFRSLSLLPGLAIFLLVTVPWYAAMYFNHGQDFIDTFLGLHNYLRATVSEHPKDNVFYYYLVLFPLSLLPWTGIFFRSLTGRKSEHFTFLAVWLAVIIGFYTLMATKYPTYVFPALFPAALLTAGQLDRMRRTGPRQWLWLSLPVLVMLAGVCGGARFFPGADWTPIYALAGLSAAVLLWLHVRAERSVLPWASGIIIVIISTAVIYQGLIPLAGTRSAKEVARALPATGAVVAAYGNYPASANFYSGYLIPRLVHDEPPAARQDVWAGKYTMPVETVAAFAARTANKPEVYLLVSRGAEPPLGGFYPVAESARLILYKQQGKR